MRLLALLTLIGPLLTGCVGMRIHYNHSVTRDDLSLSTFRGAVISANQFNSVPTAHKSDVLQFWGKPDSTQLSDGHEKWFFSGEKIRWNGIILLAIIPVPLLVPVGHEYVALTFEGDDLVNIDVKSENTAGFMCPYLEGGHAFYLCNGKVEQRQDEIPEQFLDRSGKRLSIGGLKGNTLH